jgi:3-oxoacyl-(acyl-carrier-protein) synthase
MMIGGVLSLPIVTVEGFGFGGVNASVVFKRWTDVR